MWGSGLRGMLGHKDEDDEKVPRVVESLLGKDVVLVACGVAHTMAVGGEHLSSSLSLTLSQQSQGRSILGALDSMVVLDMGTCEIVFLL